MTTKKLVYMELKNVTENELIDMMVKKFSTLTQRGIDRELESITNISHRTWSNYKMNTPLKKTILKDLEIFEMKRVLTNLVKWTSEMNFDNQAIREAKEFLNRKEK